MSLIPNVSKTADPKETQDEEVRIRQKVSSPATRRVRVTVEVLDERGEILATEKLGFMPEGKANPYNHALIVLMGKQDGAVTGFNLSNLASLDELRTMLKVTEATVLDQDVMAIRVQMAQNEAKRRQSQIVVPK